MEPFCVDNWSHFKCGQPIKQIQICKVKLKQICEVNYILCSRIDGLLNAAICVFIAGEMIILVVLFNSFIFNLIRNRIC